MFIFSILLVRLHGTVAYKVYCFVVVGIRALLLVVLCCCFVFQLSVEDFSWQDAAGKGSFSNLENISRESGSVSYLPFVYAPLHAFRRHLPAQDREWYNLKLGPNSLSSDDVALNETLLYVNLDDATSDEDRPELLKRHGNFVVLSSVFVDMVTLLCCLLFLFSE
jgi:hypothetical protein